jgi:hypothetical protein
LLRLLFSRDTHAWGPVGAALSLLLHNVCF